MTRLCLNLLNFGTRYADGAVPLVEQLDAAAEAGAELVGLDAGTLRRFLEGGRRIEEAANELSRRGLRCHELLYLFLDPAAESRSLESAAQLGAWAGALGADWVLAASGAPVDARSAELFGRCCDAACRSGTALALEFFPWAPVDRFARALDLVRRAGRPNAAVLLDCWHFFHGPDDWRDLEALPLEEVAYVQFTDTDPEAPDDLAVAAETRRRFPGEGCLDLERFAATLQRRGFDGVVSIEVLSPETRALGVRDYARRCLETSRRYWK